MSLVQDLGTARRNLVRSPSFTLPVLLSLAFAIGATVAAFTIVNTLVLRTLPVAEPSRLFQVTHGGDRGTGAGANYTWYEQVRDSATSVAAAALTNNRMMKVVVGDQVESLNGQRVSGDYFSTLGIAPLLGRLIDKADEPATTSRRVAVISDAFWARRFGRAPSVLGTAIVVDQVRHEIVGVTPAAFFGLQVGQRIDVSVPLDGAEVRQGWLSMPLVVRLSPPHHSTAVTPEAATAELTTLLQQFFAQPDPMAFGRPMSDRDKAARFKFVRLEPIASGLGGLRRQFLDPAIAFLVLVGVMLLLACANWATLSMARASARRRDMTIRVALGAARGRLARQWILESVLLALAGGALGFLAASWGVTLLEHYLPAGGRPVDLRIAPDARVLLFTLAVSSLTGLLFGLAPAWLTGRLDARDLRTAGTTEDARSLLLGRGLVVVQVALSVVLVVAAAFFALTLRNLRHQDMGFAADASGARVLLFTIDGEDLGLEGAPLIALQRRMLDRLRTLPAVERVTLGAVTPLSGNVDQKPIAVPGFVPASPDDLAAQVNTVAPDFFDVFGIPILRGRAITASDAEGTPRVALASESAARFYFPGVDPIGRSIVIKGATTTQVEIVGVVKDMMERDLRTAASRTFYVPLFQRNAEGEYTVAIRTSGNAEALTRLVQNEMNALVPGMPALVVTTMAREIDGRLVNERLLAIVSGLFGGLALLLAGIGIYGVVAYAVARRTPELGLRVALGAGRGHVVWLVLRGMVAILALGIGAGLAAALSARGVIASLLYGLPPSDARVYVAAVVFLAAIGLVASLAPLLRALRIQPMMTLRRE